MTLRIVNSCLPFDRLEAALSAAQDLSRRGRSHRYVIQSGDRFFVSTTAQVQFYEVLCAHYRSGRAVAL